MGDRFARVYLADLTQRRMGSRYAACDAMKPCKAMTPAPRDQASLEPSERVIRIDEARGSRTSAMPARGASPLRDASATP